jgi:hypothetical protein
MAIMRRNFSDILLLGASNDDLTPLRDTNAAGLQNGVLQGSNGAYRYGRNEIWSLNRATVTYLHLRIPLCSEHKDIRLSGPRVVLLPERQQRKCVAIAWGTRTDGLLKP